MKNRVGEAVIFMLRMRIVYWYYLSVILVVLLLFYLIL